MVKSTADELLALVSKLQNERADHVARIEAIDRTFSSLGIAVSPIAKARRVGRPPGRPAGRPVGRPVGSVNRKKGKRTRGRFEVSGDQAVLDFVKQNKVVTTKQVNDFWVGQGRKGKADNALSKLTREGKLQRKNIKGERGSQYRVA